MMNATGGPPTLTTSDGRIFIPQIPFDPNPSEGSMGRNVFNQFPMPSDDGAGNRTLTQRMVVVHTPGTPVSDEVQPCADYLEITTQAGLNAFIQSQGQVLMMLLQSVPFPHPSGRVLLDLYTPFVHAAAAAIGMSEPTEASSSEESQASSSNQ